MQRNITTGLCLSLLLIIAGCSGTEKASQKVPISDTETLLSYQNSITENFLRHHLSIFAADSMEGRETGTPGERKAAEYLSEQYAQMGLIPVGDNDTYYQHFDLNTTQNDSIIFETYTTTGEEKSIVSRSVASSQSTADYIRAFGGTDSLNGEIIFAGFGVNDPAREVAHLEGADLQGKWVMVFQDIPHVENGDTLISSSVDNRSRFNAIFGAGAEGILLISDMSEAEFEEAARADQSAFGEPSNMQLAYLDDGNSSGQGPFSKGYNMISPDMAAQMLNLVGGADAIRDYREKILQNIKDFSLQPLNYSLAQMPYTSKNSIRTENVLAYIDGSDPELKDEVVVITSHYDHVGIGQPDSTGDRIYNGADDDGSGTIGLLNIAHAFHKAAEDGVRPRRSILFLNVTAEEKGLLGSRYYSDHPVFPIENTVANINSDMIGRIDEEHEEQGIEEYAYIIGGEIISSDLDSLIKAANSRSGQIELNNRYNDLQDPNQFYRRSDHWNFGRLGVPFAFFFTGIHEDYHQPSDEVHKIRFEKLSKIVRTMYASTVLIANADQPPAVDNQQFIEITKEN
ncbi:M28 family peptidase [Aliifodinibius salicampi]|uniref:M28 family peptidase n=1 Tax=Fodinibius salicampi TaxID=1920655 RepID=A0ABT3Q161_9BACT|nr:M28 family peptidase [Fodinibius salicampi]MCW9713864.1 M28 family peptidase [Fodinibius salicampi]